MKFLLFNIKYRNAGIGLLTFICFTNVSGQIYWVHTDSQTHWRSEKVTEGLVTVDSFKKNESYAFGIGNFSDGLRNGTWIESQMDETYAKTHREYFSIGDYLNGYKTGWHILVDSIHENYRALHFNSGKNDSAMAISAFMKLPQSKEILMHLWEGGFKVTYEHVRAELEKIILNADTFRLKLQNFTQLYQKYQTRFKDESSKILKKHDSGSAEYQSKITDLEINYKRLMFEQIKPLFMEHSSTIYHPTEIMGFYHAQLHWDSLNCLAEIQPMFHAMMHGSNSLNDPFLDSFDKGNENLYEEILLSGFIDSVKTAEFVGALNSILKQYNDIMEGNQKARENLSRMMMKWDNCKNK